MSIPLSKADVANQYGYQTGAFMKRLNSTKGLLRRLIDETAYYSRQKRLTPKQIAIIYEFFGNPTELHKS